MYGHIPLPSYVALARLLQPREGVRSDATRLCLVPGATAQQTPRIARWSPIPSIALYAEPDPEKQPGVPPPSLPLRL